MVNFRCTGAIAALVFSAFSGPLTAQVNVTTFHNDVARTGQNLQETVLTPSNVNVNQFGKLFSVTLDGTVYAGELYLSKVSIGGGTHNVLYVSTEHDSVYAIDADSGTIYAQVSLIAAGGTPVNSINDLGCTDLVPEIGITGTPVIDPASGTLYVVAKSNVGGNVVQYLHALDVVTLAEKFGGPTKIQASVAGKAVDGNGSVVTFSPHQENQRAALLFQNGHVIIGWGSHCDHNPWHGWVMSYSGTTLAQEAVFMSSPNTSNGGVWMSGGGIAADSAGNIYFSTGNGHWDGVTEFGDSIMKLGPPSGGAFPVIDYFTPYDQALEDANDVDVSAGAVALLPVNPSGKQWMTLQGKEGAIYLVDTGNLGKYCRNLTPACTTGDTQIVQEIQGASSGIWGGPTYWNGNLYWTGANDPISAYSFNPAAVKPISTLPTSQSAQIFPYSAPTPIISANGNLNGILWALDGAAGNSSCTSGVNCLGLYAYDATNLGNLLYSSNQAASNRDSPGNAAKFQTPIVANGKVYVGAQGLVTAYGQLSISPTAASPTFSPAPGSYTAAQSVTIADATPGATIYYTTNGATPTTGSTVYTGAIAVSTTETLKAIATASGYLNSGVSAGQYTISVPAAASPTFSPAAGSYTAAQSVTIADATPGATIYYTTNGATPTTGSTVYTGAIAVSTTETLKAIAAASGFSNSPVASATYTIGSTTTVINDPNGFSNTTGFTLIGGSSLSGTALKLTDGGANEARAIWYSTPVNVQSFTTDFNFQDTAATADGFTFTLQNSAQGTAALGQPGGGLGYQGIGSSVAVKFDLFNNTNEGSDSTGFYTNGASPTVPSVDMSASGVNLHSGDAMHAHITYDGTTLTLTLTDTVTSASFTTSTVINIPGTVGANTAYVGFTGGTGGSTAVQSILNWSYTATAGLPTAASPTFSPAPGSYTAAQSVTIADATPGATIYYTTNGATPTTGSTVYTGAIAVSTTETLKAIATASGYLNSGVSAGQYTISVPAAASPTFSPAAGSYTAAQSVTIADATPGATIYYTTNGATPTTGSTVYTGAIAVSTTETLKAIAAASGFSNSPVASATYTIGSTTTVINDPNGFSNTTGFTLIGGSSLSGTALKLTDGGANEARAIWYSTPVNVQSFTTDFNFQDTAATADGFTFTLQNSAQGTAALGQPGGGLGYQGIGSSVAVKFDLFNNTNEGSDSTGFYTNGASPTVPSVDMSASGVNLHSGDAMHAHITYDGTTLTLTLTDTVTSASFTTSTVINIPGTVGANTAYVGFTGGTGGSTAVQSILNWSYTATAGLPTAASPTFSPAPGSYTAAQSVTIADATPGATIYYTTNGATPTTGSTVYTGAIAVSTTETLKAIAAASGFSNSPVASATYTIGSTTTVINDPNGFSNTTGFTLIGGSSLSGTALKLTDGGANEARAIWYSTPVNVQSFTTDFNFQDTAATADGFTFTLQNSAQGTAALGQPGGGLGYQGIGSSVAVKFDLFNNTNEGSDSTGFYTNGASPTVPSVDMSASGVNLHSGDAMHAHITYDGTTLTLTLTDTVTSASFTTSTVINIPGTVGANTAYVGFTGGTGGSTAVQSILNWSYTH